LFSYLFGNIIYKYPKKGWIHFLGVCGVLLVLIIFKYLGFLTGIYNSLADFIKFLPKFEILKLLLPLGISYIVFKHISYLTDIKWGLVKPGRFINFLLYSSLFTILLPDLLNALNALNLKWKLIRLNLLGRILIMDLPNCLGMFKKLVLADWIGYLSIRFGINPIYIFLDRVIALVGYAFQIYLILPVIAILRSSFPIIWF
jgi:alginate O-acetyltransferase complex protein AlgI